MKKALLCGTNEHSAGCILGKRLLGLGWEVFLYSRTGKPSDAGRLHIRKADTTDGPSLNGLLSSIGEPDLVICAADSGGVFGEFADLRCARIKTFLDTKILGSVLMLQELIRLHYRSKVIFLCGTKEKEAQDLLLYGVTNVAIMSLVEAVNTHFTATLQAYYLETPVLQDSPKEQEYREVTGNRLGGLPAGILMNSIVEITRGNVLLGHIPFTEGVVI